MCDQYYQEKGALGTITQASKWTWYKQMDDIFVKITKVNGVS
jgi:hypothetical protein